MGNPEAFLSNVRTELTDEDASHIVLKGLNGSYVSHSYTKCVSANHGVQIAGSNHLVLNCDLGYSSASVLSVAGRDHRIINCKIHHGGYAGLWKAGCDLKNPPDPLPEYETSRIPWMNMVKNACFEFGTFEGWEKTDAARAELVKGNGWGNNSGKGKAHATGTSKHELKLGPGNDGIQQTVKELTPNTTYTLSAWMRVSDKNETIVLGVKDHGLPEASTSVSAIEWTRRSIDFTTGQKATEATIYLRKSSQGEGSAWCDNVTLPLTPMEWERENRRESGIEN